MWDFHRHGDRDRQRDRGTGRQRQKDRQTNIQTELETDTNTERGTGRQTKRERETSACYDASTSWLLFRIARINTNYATEPSTAAATTCSTLAGASLLSLRNGFCLTSLWTVRMLPRMSTVDENAP